MLVFADRARAPSRPVSFARMTASRWRREAKEKMWSAFRMRPSKAAIRYIPDGRLDPFDALNGFCAWAWDWRNVWVCVEEVSESFRSVSSAGIPPELRRIVNQGRHKGINAIFCGLRYAEIPRVPRRSRRRDPILSMLQGFLPSVASRNPRA